MTQLQGNINFVLGNPDIPDWLAQYISPKCSCGSLLVVNQNLTRLWCPNSTCPNHLSYRAKWLADQLGVKGYGPKTCYDVIIRNQLQSHLDFISIWFEEKPKVYLWEAAKYACIHGVSDEWRGILGESNTIEDYFANTYFPDERVVIHQDTIRKACTYFTIKPVFASKFVFYVWLTGSFPGYYNRQQFLDRLNEKYRGVITIYDNKKKLSGTSYLIKPATASDRSKSAEAMQRGITIITPEQFEAVMDAYYQRARVIE